MTENLFQKLEEKMMLLLTEVEDLRNKIARLTTENTTLRAEKETYESRLEAKLKDLISLFETITPQESTVVNANFTSMKPVAIEAQAVEG